MKIEWRDIHLPDFGVPQNRPEIPVSIYENRCRDAYTAAESDWLIVYGDREHYGNLSYLTGFDPRFEEAALLLGPDGERILLAGNEGILYAELAGLALDVVLYQTFSLMGQDRSIATNLENLLRDAGIKKGQTIALVGWKYLEPDEQTGKTPGFFVPSFLVDTLRHLAGDPAGVVDATHVLMHPTKGLRAHNEPEQIAAFEWAGARATQAIHRVVRGVSPGMTEYEAVSNMGFAGEPLSAHVMFASGRGPIIGLRSPTARQIQRGEGATTAIGYWGGLGCRAGLVDREDSDFLENIAKPYYRGIAQWYQISTIGISGGEIYAEIADVLAAGGLRPLLNPGHLTSLDEWTHTPCRPGSSERITSGMAFQCDIIPTPMPEGVVVNCEDPVVFADEGLRNQLSQRFPEVWSRIRARQQFMREQLGLQIADDLLPLSTIPAYFAPLWLSPSHVLTLV